MQKHLLLKKMSWSSTVLTKKRHQIPNHIKLELRSSSIRKLNIHDHAVYEKIIQWIGDISQARIEKFGWKFILQLMQICD